MDLDLLDGDDVLPRPDRATPSEVAREKLADLDIPGFMADFTPAEAAAAGAFKEDALTEGNALASSADMAGEA
jgi:hypothetical protein